MLTFNQQELANYLKVSESTIRTNFPKLCQSQLLKGISIKRRGKYPNAEYDVEYVEPEYKEKESFSTHIKGTTEELKDEIWVKCYYSEDYEISNFGRFRNKSTKEIFKGTQRDGYTLVSIHHKLFLLHRVVLMSFNPIENAQDSTVDHINGIRSDNRLENLRWVSQEENTMFMLLQRKDMNKELTRIINIYGYDETLKKLKEII